MRYSSFPVSVLFVEDAYMEPYIMQQEEENAPFQKGEVESFYTLADEGPWLVDVFVAEEITGGDEEEWHVERIHEIEYAVRCVGVAEHHEYYGNSFADGDNVVASF